MVAIRRSVDLPVDVEEAWRLVSTPDELSRWLADEVALDASPGGAIRAVDGEVREGVVERVDEGERLVWRWWRAGDESAGHRGDASRVTIAVAGRDDGARVTVTEVALDLRATGSAAGHAGRAADGPVAVAAASGAWVGLPAVAVAASPAGRLAVGLAVGVADPWAARLGGLATVVARGVPVFA